MKHFLFLLIFTALNSPIFADEQAVNLSDKQIENLGIVQGKFIPISEIPVLSAPATVLIPSNNEYVVSTLQAGVINQLNAAIGDEVKKGDVLAQIDSPDLLTLQNNYLKAHTVLKLANSAYQRDKALAQEGIIANRRVQETQSQFDAASLEVAAAKRLLEIAGGSTTNQLSSRLAIRAPISGVVLERMAVVGKRIDNLTPLYRVADLSTLWIEMAIPHERIAEIKVGDQVVIDKTQLTGEISLLGQSVNVSDQTVLARAVMKNMQHKIRVGQKLNLQINHISKQNAFKVPDTAIAKEDNKAFVFVRNTNGFVARPVTIIGEQNEDSIVSGMFTGNETIAIKGASVLKANWLGGLRGSE